MPSDSKEPPTAVEGSPSETTESEEEQVIEESPSLDLIFGILKNGRRRRVIQYLRDAEGEVTLSDLAEHIAAIENDTTPAQLTSSERKRVYVGLYQCHLPKMDDAGVVEYNQARGLVRRTNQAKYYEQYLDRTSDGSSRDWYKYYGGAAALGVVPLVLAVGFTLPAAYVSALLVTVLAVIGLCSVHHWQSANKKEDGREVSP
jgi:DNA-binding transcriptional ArsR family regulator